MADIPHSSFIPKEATGLTPGKIRKRRTFSVFSFVATALLIGSLILAGGTYFLRGAAKNNLADAKQKLDAQRSLFDEESIREVREFDRRLQAARLLLAHHISPLKIFAALEKETKQRIRFTDFSLVHDPSVQAILSLDGETYEFKTLALQEIGFEGSTILKTVPFSQVGVQESQQQEGRSASGRLVTFSLSGEVDLAAIAYDGKTSLPPVAFVESGNSLSLGSDTSEGAVLGDSVTQDDL